MLASIVGYKGPIYPGAFLPKRPEGSYVGGPFEATSEATPRQELTKKGTRLFKQDWRGRWYFMPVSFRVGEKEIEIPNAVISITGKKNFIETQLVGRKGTVKELINIDDYQVTIAGFIQSQDGTYPEDEIIAIRDLFNVNEAIDLISAFSDLILDDGDKVVITDIDFPATPGIEDGQAIRIECVTDKEFDLYIE